MPERSSSRFGWPKGYWPTTAKVMGMDGCLLGGMNLWNRGNGLLVSSKGFGASVGSAGAVNPLLNIADKWGGLTGGGSITQAPSSGGSTRASMRTWVSRLVAWGIFCVVG